jgi:hypothetical protein
MVALTGSGHHAEIVRPGTRSPEGIPARAFKGGKGLKALPPSAIVEEKRIALRELKMSVQTTPGMTRVLVMAFGRLRLPFTMMQATRSRAQWTISDCDRNRILRMLHKATRSWNRMLKWAKKSSFLSQTGKSHLMMMMRMRTLSHKDETQGTVATVAAEVELKSPLDVQVGGPCAVRSDQVENSDQHAALRDTKRWSRREQRFRTCCRGRRRR